MFNIKIAEILNLNGMISIPTDRVTYSSEWITALSKLMKKEDLPLICTQTKNSLLVTTNWRREMDSHVGFIHSMAQMRSNQSVMDHF